MHIARLKQRNLGRSDFTCIRRVPMHGFMKNSDYSCTVTMHVQKIQKIAPSPIVSTSVACTGRILPYSLACRILLASTAWGAHLQLYRYRTSRMRAPAWIWSLYLWSQITVPVTGTGTTVRYRRGESQRHNNAPQHAFNGVLAPRGCHFHTQKIYWRQFHTQCVKWLMVFAIVVDKKGLGSSELCQHQKWHNHMAGA